MNVFIAKYAEFRVCRLLSRPYLHHHIRQSSQQSKKTKQKKSRGKTGEKVQMRKKENSINRDQSFIITSSTSCLAAVMPMSLLSYRHRRKTPHNPSLPSFISSSSSCLCATALLKALTTSSGIVSQSRLRVYTSATLGPLAFFILPNVSARLGRRVCEEEAGVMVSMCWYVVKALYCSGVIAKACSAS